MKAPRPAFYEQEIHKSRFLGYLYPIETAEEKGPLLVALKKEHYKARHICSAYYLGEQTAPVCGSNDDGEPKGTAGKPILEAILQKNAHNLLIAVVRYFGGVKLGAGGLIRAYHGTAIETLNLAGLIPDLTYRMEKIELDYDRYDPFKLFCKELPVEITEESFTDKVSVCVRYAEAYSLEFPWGMIRSRREQV